jgi:hypothetical protein
MGNQTRRRPFDEQQSSLLVKLYEGLVVRSQCGKRLDKKTFLAYFKYPGLFGERIFDEFDTNRRGWIDCEEFIGGLSSFVNGTTDEKVELLFRIYTQDKEISYDKLTMVLYSLLTVPSFVPGGIQLLQECRQKCPGAQQPSNLDRPNTATPRCQEKLVPRLPLLLLMLAPLIRLTSTLLGTSYL